jgi:hypothetical protein
MMTKHQLTINSTHDCCSFFKVLATILYLSILLHFYNTILIKFYIKLFFSVCRATLSQSDFTVYSTCFGLYRPSSGVLLILAKTVTRIAIYYPHAL